MTMKTVLRSRVKDDAAVVALNATVDWGAKPQRAPYPAVVMNTISDSRDQHMAGFNGYRETVVRFACYAETQAVAETLKEAVIAAIAPAVNSGGIDFLRAQRITVLDGGDNTVTGFVHRELVQASIWHDA